MNEDPRKTGLKNGIRQLSTERIERTLEYEGEMVYDDGNYKDGMFCPLGIGAGLDQLHWAIPPTSESVAAILTLMGYKVNNTRGIDGKFFTDNRERDYVHAALEVIHERSVPKDR